MPDIPLLQPIVLRGVVQKLMAPESLTLLSSIPRTPWPFPSAKWDVIRGSRNIATPNVPNSEAHIVPKLGVSQESASFIYLREKKVFEPTTIHWLKQPGTLAATNAEAAVMREVNDLNLRFDNFAEWVCWQAIQGLVTLDYPDVQATINYKYPATHKIASPATGWSTATATQIRNDVVAWKRLIRRDTRGIEAQKVFLSEPTMAKVMNAFANVTNQSTFLLSDRMKDQFYSTGTMPGFLGLDWTIQESVYDDANGVTQQFLPDGGLVMCNMSEMRPIELMEGPSADDEAPDNFTGKFTKTWKDRDPSARQVLLEWHFLPIITRPEQFLTVTNVN